MKADKTIRLLKHVPAVNIGFTAGGNPYLQTVTDNEQVNNGWVINSQFDDPTGQSISLIWDDTIDISGLRAADLTMINQGGAIANCRPPIIGWPENATVTVTTYVSVNPIRGNYTERAVYGNSLATPSESQDWFLASSQTYVRDSTSAGYAAKIAENNWGTGGIAQTDRLFVRCYVAIVRQALFLPNIDPLQQGFAALDAAAYFATTSPMTIGIMAVTAELDAVQTAAAIYRGNDLQQTYDNP
jgi:hypothetical protein